MLKVPTENAVCILGFFFSPSSEFCELKYRFCVERFCRFVHRIHDDKTRYNVKELITSARTQKTADRATRTNEFSSHFPCDAIWMHCENVNSSNSSAMPFNFALCDISSSSPVSSVHFPWMAYFKFWCLVLAVHSWLQTHNLFTIAIDNNRWNRTKKKIK